MAKNWRDLMEFAVRPLPGAVPPPDGDGNLEAVIPGDPVVEPTANPATTHLLIPVSEVEERTVDWLWRGRIPRRTVSLVVGIGGLGKSQITLHIAAELTRGTLTGRPEPVIIFSAEDDPEAVLKPRLRALDATQNLTYILRVDADLWLPDGLGQLENMVRTLGARLVIFDPLVAYLNEEWDSHKEQHVRGILKGLHRVATEQDATMLAVMHFKKGQERDALYRVSGSAGFGNAARSVLAASEDPADERRHVLMHIKSNYGVQRSALRYHIDEVRYPLDGGTQVTSRVVFDGEDRDLTVRDVFDQRPGPEPTKLEEAKDFLLSHLAGGAEPVKEIEKLASDVGISKTTLHRAKRTLGLQQREVRDPATGKITGWTWELPSAPSGPG